MINGFTFSVYHTDIIHSVCLIVYAAFDIMQNKNFTMEFGASQLLFHLFFFFHSIQSLDLSAIQYFCIRSIEKNQ